MFIIKISKMMLAYNYWKGIIGIFLHSPPQLITRGNGAAYKQPKLKGRGGC